LLEKIEKAGSNENGAGLHAFLQHREESLGKMGISHADQHRPSFAIYRHSSSHI
jgi:hypothetical protein